MKMTTDIQQGLVADEFHHVPLTPEFLFKMKFTASWAYEVGNSFNVLKSFNVCLIFLNHALLIHQHFLGESLDAGKTLIEIGNKFIYLDKTNKFTFYIELGMQMVLKQEGMACQIEHVTLSHFSTLTKEAGETCFRRGGHESCLRLLKLSLDVRRVAQRHCPQENGQDDGIPVFHTLENNDESQLSLYTLLDAIAFRLKSHNYRLLRNVTGDKAHLDSIMRTAYMASMAARQMTDRNLTLSVKYYNITLTIYKMAYQDDQQNEWLAHVYREIGIISFKLHKYGDAVTALQKALTTRLRNADNAETESEKLADNVNTAYIANHLGRAYQECSQYNESLQPLRIATDIYAQLQEHDLHNIYSIIWLAIGYNKTMNYWECLKTVQQYLKSPNLPQYMGKKISYMLHEEMLKLGLKTSFETSNLLIGIRCYTDIITFTFSQFSEDLSDLFIYLHSLSVGFYAGLVYGIEAMAMESSCECNKVVSAF